VRSIRATKPQRFDDREYELTLGDALSQLVMGEKLATKATHQYGYALEELCKHFGQFLPVDQWGGVRWDAMEDSGVAGVMASGPPGVAPRRRGSGPSHAHGGLVFLRLNDGRR
jgi:hypothetical protein